MIIDREGGGDGGSRNFVAFGALATPYPSIGIVMMVVNRPLGRGMTTSWW